MSSMKAVAALLVVAVLAAQASWAGNERARQIWLRRSPGNREAFEEAQLRLDSLRRAEWPADPQQVMNDEDLRWLLANRVPSYMLLDRVLAEQPTGRRLRAALRVTAGLGHRSLGQYLPELLRRAGPGEERLAVIKCMAALRDAHSLRALHQLLSNTRRVREGFEEECVAAAARGLGLSGDPQYLRVLTRVSHMVRSAQARLEFAKARYRCGDEKAMAMISHMLKSGDLTVEVKLEVVEFLTIRLNPDAVELLAELAITADDEQLSVRATSALLNVTAYGLPVPGSDPDLVDVEGSEALVRVKQEEGEPELGAGLEEDEPAGPRALLGPDIEKLSVEERTKLAKEVVAWWDEKGEALAESLKEARSMME